MNMPSNRSAEQASAVRLDHSPANLEDDHHSLYSHDTPLLGVPVTLQSQRKQSPRPGGGAFAPSGAMFPATKAPEMVGPPDIVLHPRHARRDAKSPPCQEAGQETSDHAHRYVAGEFVAGERPVVPAPEIVHPNVPGEPDTRHSGTGTAKSMGLSTL